MALLETPKLPSLKVGSSTYKGVTYYYVQTYTYHYDSDKKRCVRDSQTTVGTILGNQKYGEIEFKPEFIEKYPELANFITYKTEKGIEFKPLDADLDKVIPATKIEKKIGGATWAVNQAMAQTGIGDALRCVFFKYNRHLKLASVVNYMVQEQSCVMHNYEPFSQIHWLPWHKTLNDTQLSNLFKKITHDEVISFFKVLNAQYQKKYGGDFSNRLFVALDSTSISTYSNTLSQSDYGHNKDGDTTKQINYLMVCDVVTGAPVYAKSYKGNVVDVTTVKRLMIDLETVFNYKIEEAQKPNLIFVTDRGYDSSDNLQSFLRHGYSFIMRSKIGSNAWVRDFISSSYEELHDDNNHDEFFHQFMYTVKAEYKYDAYPIDGKNKRNKDVQEVYVHMYFDEDIEKEQHKNLRSNINSARKEFNDKVKEYRDSGEPVTPELLAGINIGPMQEFITEYCVFDSEGYAKIDTDKINKRLKFSGYMVLISDTVSDAKEAYFAYKQRQTVERNFEVFKSVLKFDRVHCYSEDSFRGRFLCQFIATAVATLFNSRIREYEKTDDSKKDKFRLNSMSLVRVLKELNTIMLTCYKGGFYFDEVSGKYRYLYKALGIPVPEAQYRYTNEVQDAEEEPPYETPDPEFQDTEGPTL